MPFDHACFISYSHNEGLVMKGFMKQLEEALNSSLSLYIKDKKVFKDDKLLPGDDFEKKLAMAICRSICMIVVYSPSYEDSAFSLREFAAMEDIEERRKHSIKNKVTCDKRMIIPIILRGEDELPSKIKACVHYCDCSRMSLSSFLSGDISSNPAFLDKIETISKAIYIHYKEFEDVDMCKICESFELPKEKILPWRTYLFNWQKIENEKGKLIDYLKRKFGIDWIETAEIEKTDDMTINLFIKNNSILMKLNNEKTRARLIIDDNVIDEFIAKMEMGTLNIYKKPMDPFPKM